MYFGEENQEKIFDANDLIYLLESTEIENEENKNSLNVKVYLFDLFKSRHLVVEVICHKKTTNIKQLRTKALKIV